MEADSPLVAVDARLTFHAVNPAYERVTGLSSDDLVFAEVFEVFPPNPDEPQSDGPAQVRRSFEKVLESGRADHLVSQRYDIPDYRGSAGFVERYWLVLSEPVWEEKRLAGVRVRVEDVSSLEERQRRLLAEHWGSMEGRERLSLAGEQVVDAEAARLNEEVVQLRQALETRATIDQAKGIIMAERGCGPQAAFGVLVGISQDTNVKLRDVAAALVSRAVRDDRIAS